MLKFTKEKLNINDNSNIILQKISELHIIYDFHQIINILKEPKTLDMNRLFTYLIMLSIKRKIEK